MDDGVDEIIGVLKIIITGPNEAPEFSASLYSFTIPEDASNDYTVGSVAFIDEGKIQLMCSVSIAYSMLQLFISL